MATRLNTPQELNKYIASVIKAAIHHAPNVNLVIPILQNEVLARFNLTNDKIEVYERNGKVARTCWVTLNGNRYVFSYNYGSGKIDLKSRSIQGSAIASFQNSTSLSSISTIIQNL